jgi:fructose-specific component phosphotransferase system IIB-like protein
MHKFCELLSNDAAMAAQLGTLIANDVTIMHKLCAIFSQNTEIMHKFCELLSNDADMAAQLGTLISNDTTIMHKLCELLSHDADMAAQLATLIANDTTIMHKLCAIFSQNTEIMHKLCELLSNDSVILHKLCELLSNDAVIMHKLCMILANTNTIITDLNVISSNIVNLGNPSDVSNLYNLLTLIIFNLQLDPVLQVTDAISNSSLQNSVTSADPNLVAIVGLTGYQANLAAALSACVTATTPATENPANTQLAINATNVAMSSFNTLAMQWSLDGYYTPTSPYSVAKITNALGQLKSTLMYMLSQQPA